jgi:hypothetical protein
MRHIIIIYLNKVYIYNLDRLNEFIYLFTYDVIRCRRFE